MFKSTFTTFLFLAALMALSSVANAQSPSTSGVSATTSATEAPRATGPPSASITTPPRVGGNFTATPDFASLATLIASLATAKPKPTGDAKNGATAGSATLLSTDARAGLGLVLLTTLVAAMGTLAL
ncbi:hypothetical protein BGZ70_008741 [Mortierella alpina]|uniref:Uncharacterized protein n=1 Tax=Mortierella alpina TaxID=64518 RepID=A0A9P6M1H2_MORAP|nr:hypothetical protein BGZ70_008741 [Mortierella alpina]